MAKRLFAFVLVLAMLVSLMPQVTVGISAEGTEKAPGASEWCDHTSHDGWTPWGDDEAERTTLPTAEGKYYLTADVEMSAAVTISKNIHMCLDGRKITQTKAATRFIYLDEGKGITLSIYDCKNTGTITGGSGTYGSVINVTRTNTFSLYGGKLTGNNATGTNAQGVVYVQAAKASMKTGGTFNMYGGEISSNTVRHGGAVYVAGGVNESGYTNAAFNMYGGKLSDNTATNNGGAVFVTAYGSVNIAGGEISGNNAKHGAAIYSSAGNVTISDASLKDNIASGSGGAVYVTGTGTMNITDTQITGNTAATAGSAIYAEGYTPINLKDTTITGNTGTNSSDDGLTGGWSSAVYLCGRDNPLTVSGKVVISGNTTAAANIADVVFNVAAYDTLLVNELTAGSDIKFKTNKTSATAASEVVALAEGGTQKGLWQSEWVTYTDKDGNTQSVTYGDNNGTTEFYFVDGHYHGSQKYIAWTETAKLPSADDGGAGYYLDTNVTVTAQANRATVTGGNSLHLCMNGHTVGGNNAYGEMIRVENGNLYISDCTTVYDEDGYFVSGGKFENCKRKGNGAAIYANNAASVIEIVGVEFSGNTSTETTSGYGGGAVQFRKNNTAAKLIGCKFSNNTSSGDGGALALREGGTAYIEKTIFTENHADGAGGAIYATGGVLTIENSKINDNEAVGSGAIYSTGCKVTIKDSQINDNDGKTSTSGAMTVTGASVLNMTNTEMKGNTAKTVSVMNILGNNTQVTLTDVTITGNESTGATYGAVNLGNGSAVVKLVGKTVIYDNLNKDDAQQNLHLQQYETADYDVSGLTAGAKVGVSLLQSRIDAGYMYFSTTGMTSDPGYCVSDDDAYKVELDAQGRLALVENTGGEEPTPPVTEGHTHKLCNDASCNAHGGDVTFKAWGDDANEVGLPTSGDYYLFKDINVSATTVLTGNLNLCLNGKTITQTGSGRIYTINAGGRLAITDCAEAYTGNTYTGGVITGGEHNTGSAVYVTSGTTFELYGGRIANCGPATKTSAQTGAAVFLHSASSAGATFNMYGGEITECGGEKNWGGAISNGGGNAGKTVYVNIYGGKIFGNTAMDGAAIRLQTDGVATIYGGEIYGNNAANTGGAILLNKGTTLNLQGGNIHDNTAAVSGGAIQASATASQITLSGAPSVQNNKVGAAQNNLYLDGDVKFEIDGLTAGAKIGLSRSEGRTTEEVSSNTATTADLEFFTNDDTQNYQLKLKNDRVALTLVTDHMHEICNIDGCPDHEDVPFVAWGDDADEKGKLPESGNYYLTEDVELDGAATIRGELNLCLNGYTIKQTKASTRVINVSQDSVLTLTDCNAAPGSITGGVNDYGSAVYLNEGSVFNLFGGRITGNTPVSENASNTGAAIFLRSASKGGATFNMYGGEITGNGNDYSWGGAVSNGLGNAGKTVYVNIYGGKITGNTAGTGGAIRLSNGAVLTVAGGEITDNTAATGGAVYLVNGAELKLEGGKISGNSADLAGGIYTTAANTVTVSGDAVVMDNTVNGKQNNLYLDGDAVITLGAVGTDAKVGISVSKVNRAISSQSDTDYTKNFVSDSAYKTITYQDKVLYVAGSSDHKHCVCDSTVSACDHSKQVWTAWESTTSLPTSSGYYYLTEDVKLSAAADIPSNQEIYLCLNGKTVTGTKRHMIIGRKTVMSITDCNEVPGGLTGGKNTYGGSVNVTAGATLNLFAGKLYGNTAPESEGGAVYLQAGQVKDNTELPGGVFNMYGGEISGNSARYGGAIRAAGTNVDGIAPAQINIYGGVISGNKAVATVTENADGTQTKTGGNGGAIAATSSTVINLLGGKLTGNTSDGDGAGIYANAKTNITIKDAKVTDNVAGGYGGAIFATSNGTVITMESGEMSGNVSGAGGAVMTQTRSKFVLNGGKISGNQSTKSGGGGLYISTNTEFVMNGGEISGNSSSTNGGGFYALRSKVTLNGGVISGNKAANRAGGIALSGAEGEINKITIKGNSANEGGAAYINRTSATSNGVTTYYPSTVTINDGAVITGNKATTNCGGILMANEGTEVTMVGGEITKNTAKNGAGLMTWSQSLFVMKGGKINNNTATGSGGGIYISTNTTFKLEGGQVNNNTAKSGGGIYFLRSTGVLSGGTVSNNRAKEEVKWTDGKETKSGGSAGGIYISGSKLDLKGTYITNNKADSNGGGIVMGRASYKENGVTKYDLVKVNIYSGVVSGNFSGASAGGMLMQSEGTVVNMYGGTFTKNTSTKSGGGIYVSTKTTFNMTGGRVVENHAETTGGGIYAYKSTANISGGELNSNTAVTNGGNLVASGGTVVVTIKNMKLYGGEAKTAGCLVVQTQDSVLNVENCEIYDNQSTGSHGGAVFVSNKAYGNFTNCKFFDNQSALLGGAVLVNNFANATFTGCEFYENNATTQGGALWTSVASNTTVENCTFTKNTAGTRGGAITCKGNMLLKNSVVENNTAAEEGGGIYTDTNTTTGSGIMEGMKIENSVIRNNTATLQGGGLYIFKGCRMEIYRSEITGNKSGAEGGAIWAYEDLELHDTTITGNTSGGEGFAVYMNDAAFDGHSYFTSRNKMSGNVIIKDNENGNLWMGPDVVIAITADGMGSDTHIELTLDSGVVTNRIFGAFHYEGGNQVYTITSGDRSITDPEYDASLVGGAEEEEAKANAGDIVLYVGIGIFALAVIAVVILLLAKKKKADKTAEEATKE